MSTEITRSASLVPAPFELARMTNEELRAHIGRAISMTAESIAYLAAVWVELERRGEDMSGLRISLAPFLRDVAQGRLAPEAVLSFAGQKMVLKWVAKRPISEQLSLAAGKPVTIITDKGDRKQILPADLSVTDLRLIESRPDSVEITASTEPAVTDEKTETVTSRKAEKTLVVPVSDDEYASVLAQVHESGLSISNFLRLKLGLAQRKRGRK